MQSLLSEEHAMTSRLVAAALLALALSLSGAGCGDNLRDTSGSLDIRIYGEPFIEEGIPADVFADGWSVRFDSFLVSVGEVTAGSAGDDAPALEDATYRIFDLARPSAGDGFTVLSAEVPGGAYDDVGFRLRGGSSAVAGNAGAEDVAFMNERGYSMYVEGVATRGDEMRTFAWGFTTATTYRSCQSVAVVAGAPARSVLTIHADHLFYDDLVSEEPAVRFDAVAGADADGDGDITSAELAAVDITGFERYQVGSFEVEDLWTFIDHQASTVGHIDGEGHCAITVRD
jgi:hypothetical protein